MFMFDYNKADLLLLCSFLNNNKDKIIKENRLIKNVWFSFNKKYILMYIQYKHHISNNSHILLEIDIKDKNKLIDKYKNVYYLIDKYLYEFHKLERIYV